MRFEPGVRRYMRRYAYANSVTDDLWRQMDRGSARPITQIAHDLTLQAGVPMVSEASLKCQDDSSTLSLSQGHFAIDADSTQARVWHVPVIAAILGRLISCNDHFRRRARASGAARLRHADPELRPDSLLS
jgi:aminopeptidase N